MYLKPKKDSPFRRSLPVYAIIGSTPGYIGKSSHPSSVDPLFINESIFKNQLQLDVCTKKCASNNTRLIKALYQISATLGVLCPLIACASFYYCTSYIKPSLSNKLPPPAIQGKKIKNKPPISFKPPFPSPFLFFNNEWYTVLINHDF